MTTGGSVSVAVCIQVRVDARRGVRVVSTLVGRVVGEQGLIAGDAA